LASSRKHADDPRFVFGAVLSVVTREAPRGPAFYHAALRPLKGLSHLTVEVNPMPR